MSNLLQLTHPNCFKLLSQSARCLFDWVIFFLCYDGRPYLATLFAPATPSNIPNLNPQNLVSNKLFFLAVPAYQK